jgi:hypothetical protein
MWFGEIMGCGMAQMPKAMQGLLTPHAYTQAAAFLPPEPDNVQQAT